MSRRNAAEKRPVLPDPQFNNRLASMMVHRLMKHGKKSTAQKILSDAFGLINERTGSDNDATPSYKNLAWSTMLERIKSEIVKRSHSE